MIQNHLRSTELRIGNTVQTAYEANGIADVVAIEPGSIHISTKDFPDNEMDIQGILITPYWVVKCGFVPQTALNWYYPQNENIAVIKNSGKYFLRFYNRDIAMNFVHELQNLLHLLMQ